VETVELTPYLHLFRFRVGQAYLWNDGGSLTLIDTGTPGSGAVIKAAITGLGLETSGLARIVLTHFHGDHTGSAAEIREWSDAPVIAHRLDAPMIRGERPAPAPNLAAWERPLFEQFGKELPLGPPVHVDSEVDGGEVLDFGGGAQILAVPGHTDGSIAVHLPEHGALFTGDAIAEASGDVMPGVFNTDRARALESFRHMAELDLEIACFGHGDPVLTGASDRLREASQATRR
jgi:glyoxylase-like metal-dependent hydrolase (beta-lactamase superfamily II)